MPKFKVAVTDDVGDIPNDKRIEAGGPMEACAKAVADAGTADVAETEEQLVPMQSTTGDNNLPSGA